MRVSSYLQIPFEHGGRSVFGADCWGLVKIIYATELNIDLWDLGTEDYDKAWHLKGRNYFMENYQKEWHMVNEPEMFDVVLIRNDRGVVNHIGVCLDSKRFIHCLRGGTTVSKIAEYRTKIEGYVRHDKCKILSY